MAHPRFRPNAFIAAFTLFNICIPQANSFILPSLIQSEKNTFALAVASPSKKKVISSVKVKEHSSPAAQFGEPLSTDVKDFNKEAIGFIKTSIFDTIFPPASSHTENPSRAYARFYALETIARMPYFSYLSVLHLYETLGWFRRANYLKLHFAESWNELHHLLIMEELGGNNEWKDRFVAQHTAFFYYWFVVSIYLVNPILAYNLNQAVEEHAFETYDKFLQENEEYLKQMEAPEVAKNYYTGGDLYLLDEMQTDLFQCDQGKIKVKEVRSSPIKIENLYDVFVAIRDDELEHARTMAFLQDQNSDIDLVKEDGDECEIDYDNISPTALMP